MAYTAQLSTLHGEGYLLTIDGTGVGTGELTLSGDNPVTIEYDQDDIFKPLKMSACSVTVLASAPLLDLYTGTLNGVTLRVERGTIDDDGVFSGGTLIWFGFLTPNVYSSGYKDVLDELTLEFVDPLSAMENCKFAYFDRNDIDNDDTPSEHFFASFWNYMLRALHCVGALNYVRQVVIKGSCDIDITTTGCMQHNFIDETDDEENGAKTWQEVLESIGRYLHMTMCIYGDTLYYFDSLATGETAKDISVIGIAEGNGSISLGEVYNKVTVIASNNPIDDTVPDPFDDDDLVAEETSPKYHSVKYVADQIQYNERSGTWAENDDVKIYKLMNAAFTSKKWNTSLEKELTYGVSYHKGDNERVYLTESPTVSDLTIVPWDEMMIYTTTDNGKYYCLQQGHVLGSFIQRYSSVETKGVTASVDWKKCITLGSMVGRTDRPSVAASASIKDASCPQLISQGGYLVLSVKFIMSYWAYPQSECQEQEIDATDEMPLALTCTLKIGDYYYSRDDEGNGSWSLTPGTFQIKHTCDDKKYKIGQEVSIDNEVPWDLGLNVTDEGYLIALPTDFILNGKISFVIQNDDISEQHVQPTYYHVTDIMLQYATKSNIEDIFNLEDDDTDITYTGYIEGENISEMDDVEFIINTFTDKSASYSYAINYDHNAYTYITSPVQEQECISRLVSYYSKARMTYQNTVNDKNGAHILPWDNWTIPAFSGRTFTTGSITFNLADDSADITMLEID